MSRTASRQDADLAKPDGHIFIAANEGFLLSTTGTVAATYNASGDVSVNLSASSSVKLILPLSRLIYRYGAQDWTANQFGSAQAGGAQGYDVGGFTTLSTANASAGSAVNIAVASSIGFLAGRSVLVDTVASGVQEKAIITAVPDGTHITVNTLANSHTSPFPITQNLFTTPAGVTGPPPFTGVTSLTPLTSPRPKGIKFKEIYCWYSILTANATSNTIGITKTVAANVTANSVSTVLTNAANGLATTFNANPQLTPIQLTTANQVFQTSKYSEYLLEWDLATAAGGTARIYGVFVDVDFNF